MMAALFNHLWQSTVFAAVAGLLTLALRKNRAQVRYRLWFAASVKFLVPFALLVSLGGQFGWRTAAPPSQVSQVIEQINQPFTSRIVSPPPLAAVPAEASRLPIVLFAVWACGFVAVLFYWGRRIMRMRAEARASSPLNTPLPIPVRSSPALREPGVFGLFRPVLLLPEGIKERLTPEQLQAVLAHELCHVRRRDNLTSAIQMMVEAIFWFHPLVWWIGARLVDERERACDEEVLRQGNDPQVYAEGILNVCKFYVESPLVCVAGVTGSDLKKRIEDIMTGCTSRKLDLMRKALLTVAGIGAVAGPVAVGLLNAPRSFGQTNTSQYTFGLTTVAESRFEVASVKPGPPGEDGWQLGVPTHGGITIDNMELRKIIASSFRIQDSMVIGPSWLDSARYSIVGKGADPTVGNPVVWENMRALLADRLSVEIPHRGEAASHLRTGSREGRT
jgi:beta-lactamase regulating signal transducer with metallopeptidase domain